MRRSRAYFEIQLAALQQSQAVRARQANPGPPITNVNHSSSEPGQTVHPNSQVGTNGSPSTSTSISTPRITTATAIAGPSVPPQQSGNGQPTTRPPVPTPSIPTNIRPPFVLAQTDRMKAAQNASQATIQPTTLFTNPATNTRPPIPVTATSTPSRPPPPTPSQIPPNRPNSTAAIRPPDANSRRQFLISLAGFHKSSNLPLPSDVFNGEKDGFVKLGDIWVEVVDIFMLVIRNGGISKVGVLDFVFLELLSVRNKGRA